MEAGKRTLNEIFNGNRRINIPFFQRMYVWQEPQWERFLSDMEMISFRNEPYFLGSVILKQQLTNSNSNVGDSRTLIDGQQRLTTLNIFFKVLYLKTNRNNSFNRLFRLDIEQEPLAINHNYNDIEAFEKVMSLTELVEFDLNKYQGKIYAAYEFFRKNINTELLNDQSIKDKIMFVGIDLSSDDDEQQIFDTINSLGVRLTTAELLKNYFFNDKKDIDYFNQYWKDVFDDPEKTSFWDKEIITGRISRTMVDLFFHSFLQIKIQSKDLKISSADKTEFSRVESLFNSYKKFIKNYKVDKIDLLKEIKEYANLFIKFNFDCINYKLSNEDSIDRINNIIFGLGQSTLIPYVLYLLKNTDEEEQNKIFNLLESYMLRRIISRSNNKNYNSLFEQLISNEIDSREKLFVYLSNQQDDTNNNMPSNKELLDGFKNSKLVNAQALGVLYMLESKIRNNDKHSTQLLGMKKYSLEHLMPKKWKKNWGDCEKPDIRDHKLLTLGNLTIITQSLNASIRDSNWEIKKEGRKNNGLKAYSAGIETLTPYLKLPDWNENEIDKRALDLYEKAILVWENK